MEFATWLKINFLFPDKKMLVWTDGHCQQGTARFDLPSCGIWVIFYQLFEKVVNLVKNERSKGENDKQKRFWQLLVNLRSNISTKGDGNLLQSRTPDSAGSKKDVKEYFK